MEAPEKIYFSGQQQWSNPFIGLMQKCADTDIEYTRTVALIEKACEWLESTNLDWYQIREGVFSKQLVEDFKKYLKEE